tara:strand:+ start:305 stop:991 length:687 start_codon:yes stop_codon:yes gene_type:complete
MKTAVLFSGCGVYDGTEIHESVLTLLALSQKGIEYICVSPDINQTHVINHINGEEMCEERNTLYESARITRGDIISLDSLNMDDISSLVIPGGFGVAKNLSTWAFEDLDSTLNYKVKKLILHCLELNKPIVSLCISPILIAKVLEEKNINPKLTLGNCLNDSKYNIEDLHNSISKLNATPIEIDISDICVDEDLKIISAPCYMMDVKIDEVYKNITIAIDRLAKYLNK